jgi:hypothetical protein
VWWNIARSTQLNEWASVRQREATYVHDTKDPGTQVQIAHKVKVVQENGELLYIKKPI